MNEILKGIRVLDFGRYIAGPYCATLLADLGADVIRLEKPSGGEDRYTVPVTPHGEGAYYMQIARNKRAMTLNPTHPSGVEVIRRLVKTADVVIVNLPAPALKKMGLDYETLSAIKPDIILTTGSAFGSDGPYASRGGFDSIAQAMSGAMHLSGSQDAPARSFAPYCDFGTALSSAFGTLAAILHKLKTGEGQVVEGTLLGTALNFNNAALIEEAMLSIGREGSGTQGQYNAPTNTYGTKNGWITVQVVGAGIFKRWANLMGEGKWLNDERFSTDQSRGDHGSIISGRMNQWCQERTNARAIEELSVAGIPAGELLSAKQVLKNEHVTGAGFLQDTDYPGAPNPVPIASHPIRYSKTPVGEFERAPMLSEHTQEILIDLGYSDEEINVLRKADVI